MRMKPFRSEQLFVVVAAIFRLKNGVSFLREFSEFVIDRHRSNLKISEFENLKMESSYI